MKIKNKIIDPMKIIGVTLGWDFKPTLKYTDNKILLRNAEDIINKKYYPDGSGTWPINPDTKKEIEISL